MLDNKKYFFISGFQKSGTSTLHGWLKQISCIALPNIKETHYFSEESNYSRGFNSYLENFKLSNNTTHIGEVDPSYSLFKQNLLNIKTTFNKSPNFIFILRKPIDRAYSHFLMSKLRGYEDLNFNNSLKKEKERLLNDETNFTLINNGYFERSLYYKYIKIFYDVFPNSNPLFLKFEDLYNTSKKKKMCLDIIKYLGINCNINNIDLDKIENKASRPRSLYLQKLLYKDFLLKRVLKKYLPFRTVVKLKLYFSKINMSKIIKLNKDKEISLVDKKFLHLNDKITNEMEKIIDLDLSDWYCLK